MSDDKLLTFSQAHGYEDIPTPLQLEQLPKTARTRIWNVLYDHLRRSRDVNPLGGPTYVGDPWSSILSALHVHHYVEPLDELTGKFDVWRRRLRKDVEQSIFHRVFDLIVFIMRHSECPGSFVLRMDDVFKVCQLAYTIDPGPPLAIVPATTPEAGNQLTKSLKELRDAGLYAATGHLHAASKCVNDRDWRGSVRESIHAVESVARQVAPNESKTLGGALKSLEKQGVLQHRALTGALSKLYGYTSDEQGIRHALLDEGKANVTIDEAVFMLGACASFASYLWRKHKAAGNTP